MKKATKKVVKKKPVAMKKQMAFMLDDKLEVKVKRIMKQLKLKSLSEAVRKCIEIY